MTEFPVVLEKHMTLNDLYELKIEQESIKFKFKYVTWFHHKNWQNFS